jgi:hypothetical protein
MADSSVLLLLDEVRGKTIRLLQAVSAAEARWAPPGLQNTITWHAGHAYFLLESLTMTALGQAPQLPDGWDEMFSWNSRPDQVPAEDWPSLEVLIDRLTDQHERMRRLIGKLSDSQLAQPSARHPGDTVRRAIVHALHDEACHCGEIHLLRKLRAVRKGRSG